MCSKGKDNYLTGVIAKPGEEEPGYKGWKTENNMVMSWLINSMTNEIGKNFLFYDTAQEIWEAAKDAYSHIKNTLELFDIESVLDNLRQGDSHVTQYFNSLNKY